MSVKRVLIVDDDEDDRIFFQDALIEVDPAVKCEIANNGQEALVKLSSTPYPELIFMDLNMPIMNGFACLTEIKNRETIKDIPIIILTTTSDQKTVKQSYALGASVYFKKPNDYPTIISKLRALLKMDFKSFSPPDESTLNSFAI